MNLNIITDGLINLKTGKISPPSALLIKDGIIETIKAVEELTDEEKNSPDSLDANGKFLIPGLMDSHVHLNFSAGNDPLTDLLNSSEEELYDISLKNIQTSLNNGITAVRDCGSKNDTCIKLRNDIITGYVTGPNILTSGRCITTRGGHVNFAGIEADTKDELITAANELIDQGVNFLKLIISGGNMTPGSNPLIDQYGLEEITELVKFANSKKVKVSAHIHTKEGMIKALKAGVHIIEHGSWRVPDGIDIDQTVLDMMGQNGTVYCTALPNIYTKNPESLFDEKDRIESFRKLQNERIETTVKNIQSGMTTILGTDAGTKNNTFDELPNHACLIQKETGMENIDIIKMMTVNPAEVFNLTSRGIIENGKVADILILNENPLNNLENIKDIHAVIKSGQITGMRFD